MQTIFSCKDRQTYIGPEPAFVIIEDWINPTPRKKFAKTISQGDFTQVQEDVREQAE